MLELPGHSLRTSVHLQSLSYGGMGAVSTCLTVAWSAPKGTGYGVGKLCPHYRCLMLDLDGIVRFLAMQKNNEMSHQNLSLALETMSTVTWSLRFYPTQLVCWCRAVAAPTSQLCTL